MRQVSKPTHDRKGKPVQAVLGRTILSSTTVCGSADYGCTGVALDEVSPGHRSLSLFKSQRSSYTIRRGRHDLFRANSISANHAELIFKDQSIVISDLGSTNGTFLNSHPDRLLQDKQYPLHDGDTIVFGLDLRVKVKFLYSDSTLLSPRDSHQIRVNETPSSRASSRNRDERSVTPNLLASGDSQNSGLLDVLPHTIKISWELDRQLNVGDGYDALTYRQKTTALESTSTGEVAEIHPFSFKCIQSSRELFKDKELHGTVKLDVAEFGLGLSRSSSSTSATSNSTVMIHCTARATAYVSLKHPRLHEKAEALLKDNYKAFHDMYGDYFVSGMERSYGFVVIVTLQCNSELAKDDVGTEAIAYLRSIYAGVGVEAGGGTKVSKGGTTAFKLQDVFYRPWGTTASPLITSYLPDELHRAWETIKQNPDRGRYENAILSSYCHRFPRYRFNKQPMSYAAYTKLEEIVNMYVELKRDSSHPAVRGHEGARHRTKNALKTFERLRHSQEGLRHARTELSDARGEVEKALRFYAFISEVSSLKDKMIRPSEGYKHEERWRCGRIHGVHLPTSEDKIHKVELAGGIPAMEAVFLRPLKSHRGSKHLFNIIGSPEHFINFRSSGSQMATVISGHRPLDDSWKTFEFVSSFPILIVGWSLSCGTATKKTRVAESSGGILESSLTIKISESPKGDEQWHCRVAFVNKEEFGGFLYESQWEDYGVSMSNVSHIGCK